MPSYESQKDFDIFKHLARCMYARAVDVATLTDRDLRSIQIRLQKLTQRGYLAWIPSPYNTDEHVYYLTQLGWDKTLEMGATDYEVKANREKRDGHMKHDLQLTRLYVALYRILGERIARWSQLTRSRKERYGNGPQDKVNTDAVFSVRLDDGGYAIVLVEIENQKGIKESLNKLRAHCRFAQSKAFRKKFGDNPCLSLLLKENDERLTNVLKAAHEDDELATRMFLLATYKEPTTYRTPVDFETRTWGFQDLAALV
ncbi:MAG TPA: replication-relaxation family protein [Thermoanaerobaculia bacterium]|jgi:hypothetical protein